MNKKVYAAVMERADGCCEICGKWFGETLQLHHCVSGSGKRNNYETKESCMALCQECHHEVTNNRKLDLALKKIVQERYRGQGFLEEQIREKMGGRLY